MNFTINLNILKDRLRILHKSVTSAGTIADGMDVKIKTDQGQKDNYLEIEFVGAQGYAITRMHPERIDDCGEAVLNSNHLLNIPEGIGGDVTFALQKNKKMRVFNEKMEHIFETSSDEEWNRLPVLKGGVRLSGDVMEALAKAIPHVCRFSKSTKEWDVHSAVRITFKGNTITLQATDIQNAIQKIIKAEGMELPDLDLYVPSSWLETWISLAGKDGLKLGYQEGSSFLTIISAPAMWKITHNTLDGSKFRDVMVLIDKLEKMEFTSDLVFNAVRTLPMLDCATRFQLGDPEIRITKQKERITLGATCVDASSTATLNVGNEIQQLAELSEIKTNKKAFKQLMEAAKDLSPETNIHIRASKKVVYGTDDNGLSILTSAVK